VRSRDGHWNQTQGCCRDVEVQLEGCNVKRHFFGSNWEGWIWSLGVTWVGKLGEVKVNWRTLTMYFSDQDSQVKIKGDPTLAKTLIPHKLWRKKQKLRLFQSYGKNVELESRDERTNHLTEKQQGELEKIQKDCKGVFCGPKVLPPHREVDQKIRSKLV